MAERTHFGTQIIHLCPDRNRLCQCRLLLLLLLSNHCPVLISLLEIKQEQVVCALTLEPVTHSPHEEEKEVCNIMQHKEAFILTPIYINPAHSSSCVLGFNSHFPFILSSPVQMRKLFSVSEVSILISEHAQRHGSFMCPMVGSRKGGWRFIHRRFCNQLI